MLSDQWCQICSLATVCWEFFEKIKIICQKSSSEENSMWVRMLFYNMNEYDGLNICFPFLEKAPCRETNIPAFRHLAWLEARASDEPGPESSLRGGLPEGGGSWADVQKGWHISQAGRKVDEAKKDGRQVRNHTVLFERRKTMLDWVRHLWDKITRTLYTLNFYHHKSMIDPWILFAQLPRSLTGQL